MEGKSSAHTAGLGSLRASSRFMHQRRGRAHDAARFMATWCGALSALAKAPIMRQHAQAEPGDNRKESNRGEIQKERVERGETALVDVVTQPR